MYTEYENRIINNADGFTALYPFLGKSLIDGFHSEGEAALREGVRRYGYDRALTLRELHIKFGVKINMLSLFTIGSDLPPDPRFKRELQRISPEERVSHTLYCPMAKLWEDYGVMEIGRIYCEEFHNACYSKYAFDYTQVNLARTQTQEGDEYCAFNIVLRAANLPDELKPICFAEYDPEYVPPRTLPPQQQGKAGFNTLWIKLYYHILSAADDMLGEAGVEAIGSGLEAAAADAVKRLKESSAAQQLPFDNGFITGNYPLELNINDEPLWDKYNEHYAKELVGKHFYNVFYREAGINT